MAFLGNIGSSTLIAVTSNTINSAPANGFHVSGNVTYLSFAASRSNNVNWTNKTNTNGTINVVLVATSTGISGGEKSYVFVS